MVELIFYIVIVVTPATRDTVPVRLAALEKWCNREQGELTVYSGRFFDARLQEQFPSFTVFCSEKKAVT